MKDSTGGYETPLTVLAGVLLVGSLLALLAREEPPVRDGGTSAGGGRGLSRRSAPHA